MDSYDFTVKGLKVKSKGILGCYGLFNNKEHVLRITFVSEDSDLPSPTYNPASRKDKRKPSIDAYVPSKEMSFYHEFVKTNSQVIIKLDTDNPKGVSLETTVNK